MANKESGEEQYCFLVGIFTKSEKEQIKERFKNRLLRGARSAEEGMMVAAQLEAPIIINSNVSVRKLLQMERRVEAKTGIPVEAYLLDQTGLIPFTVSAVEGLKIKKHSASV